LKIKTKAINNILMSVCLFLFSICLSLSCLADNTTSVHKIAGHITDYNAEQIRLSESSDTYRGEEGILFIKPDAALKFELRVYIDQDYNDAVELNEKAADALEEAQEALSYRGKREPEPAVIKKVMTNILSYRESLIQAKEKLTSYRKNIKKDQDDRFNSEVCNKIILTFLDEALKVSNNNLRDALAYFYNKCNGTSHGRYYLAPENIRFVNHVYNSFIVQTSPEELVLFDIDKNNRNGNSQDNGDWKVVVKDELPEFLPFFESAMEKTGGTIYRTDPLLFLALVKKESSFKTEAVSFVGAAGLTQLMPQTAIDLGLKNIYMPEYLKKVGELSGTERELRAKAKEMLLTITKKDDTMLAKEARGCMLKSLNAGEKRKELLEKYKEELVDGKTDDRFNPQKVIEAGYLYFSRLMKTHNGDISLALASYNAGQHRVKEFNGIPPFRETISFRNVILGYYREYLERLTD
jgi:hypothetical protein